MRVRISGLPQVEQGGLRLSTNLYLGGSAIALQSPSALTGGIASQFHLRASQVGLCRPGDESHSLMCDAVSSCLIFLRRASI
jgi:hypothetical protein